jgi:hypothetical protein
VQRNWIEIAPALLLMLFAGTVASCDRATTPTGKPKLACDQSKFDNASRLHTQASASLASRDYGEANRLGKLGLSQIGTDYDPYVETLDDTGMHKAGADIEEGKGHLDFAASGRLRVLESRLAMYARTHQCRSQNQTSKPA